MNSVRQYVLGILMGLFIAVPIQAETVNSDYLNQFQINSLNNQFHYQSLVKGVLVAGATVYVNDWVTANTTDALENTMGVSDYAKNAAIKGGVEGLTGGSQYNQRKLFGFDYTKDGLVNDVLERFAEPHYFMSSWNYQNVGDQTWLRNDNFLLRLI